MSGAALDQLTPRTVPVLRSDVFQGIRHLDLRRLKCRVQTQDLAVLQPLKSLESLYIGDGSRLTDDALQFLRRLEIRCSLALINATALTRGGFEHLMACTNLQRLNVSRSQSVDDRALAAIARLTHLKELR